MKFINAPFYFLFLFCFMVFAVGCDKPNVSVEPNQRKESEAFVEMIQMKCFKYFEECSNAETGLVQDRAHNFKSPHETRDIAKYQVASVAATGFYLSAYVVAVENGWVSEKEALLRIRNALRFFHTEIENVEGFYYHFVDMKTGIRVWNSELSSIDTALFLAGVITVKEYYQDDQEIQKIAKELFERVNWDWMLNDTPFLNMGWKPKGKEGEFLNYYYDHYAEILMMYLMAIGAPKFSIPVDSWFKIDRPVKRYRQFTCIAYPSLFTHQYSHIWVDFRNKHDGIANYFDNSIQAVLANRQFCIDQKENFKTYDTHVWGLTACDGPLGYMAYGGKPGAANHDGTVAPTAAGASIAFTPTESILALKMMYHQYQDKIWGRYGFSDSFNVDRDWYAEDCIAIDQGAMLLMMENYRSELLWKLFMQNEWIQAAMEKVGFQEGTIELKAPEPPLLQIRRAAQPVIVDGDLSEWDFSKGTSFKDFRIEYGTMDDPIDFDGKMYASYDEKNLNLAFKIKDDLFRGTKEHKQIFKDDCLEIYIDPQKDGFFWGNKEDRQIVVAPRSQSEYGEVFTWSFFQGEDPSESHQVQARWERTEVGYNLEISIRLDALNIHLEEENFISFAYHDYDPHDRTDVKIVTFFEDFGTPDGKIELGKVEFI